MSALPPVRSILADGRFQQELLFTHLSANGVSWSTAAEARPTLLGTLLPFLSDVSNGRSRQELTWDVCSTGTAERQRWSAMDAWIFGSVTAAQTELPSIG